MGETFTPFDYLLNAMDAAGRSDAPAQHGYGEKRRALYAHVRQLEADSAALARMTAERDAALRRAEDNLKWAAMQVRESKLLLNRRCADVLADIIERGERGPHPEPTDRDAGAGNKL